MAAVIVPPRAGVLSATGLLAAPHQLNLVQSWADPGDHAGADQAAAALADTARRALPGANETETSFDCRYQGQSHELTVGSIDGFEAEHRRRNGFARHGTPIEVIALRAAARQASPVALTDLPDPGTRSGVHRGPAVLAEADCTIWVPAGWTAEVGGGGAWILTR